MLRKTLLILLVLGMAGPVSASTWAEALFDELSFDFGSVPSHQMLVHPFRIVNNTKNTVRIVSVPVPDAIAPRPGRWPTRWRPVRKRL